MKPSDNVLIKPNLVMERNPSGDGTDCLYTQPSVVAPVVDYALKAMQGRGAIVIGDAPMQECDFERLIAESGYGDLAGWYKGKGYNIELADFRELRSAVVRGIHIQHISDKSRGTVVDLGTDSEFSDVGSESLERMRITNYDPSILKRHHIVGKK